MIRIDPLAFEHFRKLCRWGSVVLTARLAFDMIDPALVIRNVPTSIYALVAQMTHQPDMVAWAFYLCASLMAPYLWLQIALPGHMTYRRPITQLGVLGLAGGGCMWALMATLSQALDIGAITWIFARTAAGLFAFALVLAISLNDEQKRVNAAQELGPT